MNSKSKTLTMAIPRHEQLNLFDFSSDVGEIQSSSMRSSAGKVLSFGSALQKREAEKVSEILRLVRNDVEHLRVK